MGGLGREKSSRQRGRKKGAPCGVLEGPDSGRLGRGRGPGPEKQKEGASFTFKPGKGWGAPDKRDPSFGKLIRA